MRRAEGALPAADCGRWVFERGACIFFSSLVLVCIGVAEGGSRGFKER